MAADTIERFVALGPAGSYLDGLANQLDTGCPVTYGDTFPDMMEQARNHRGTAILLPIKNTLDGQLYANVGAFQARDLRVIGAATINVIANVMGLGTLQDAKVIAGKDVALGQITDFMPHLDRLPLNSTSAAGQRIQETGDKTMLAVGSLAQIRLYGLNLLARAVQDKGGVNETTVLVARAMNGWTFDPMSLTDTDATLSGTMIMRTSDSSQAGSLHRATGELADRSINLTTIESLTIRGTRDSEFFITFSGTAKAVADLVTSERVARHMAMDILGTYPKPTTYDS